MSSATQGLPASAAVDVTKKPLLKMLFRNEPNVNRLEDLYATKQEGKFRTSALCPTVI